MGLLNRTLTAQKKEIGKCDPRTRIISPQVSFFLRSRDREARELQILKRKGLIQGHAVSVLADDAARSGL